MMPCRLQTFQANRVAFIQEQLPTTTWRYVPTTDNPADLPSRGMTAQELVSSQLWWHGPQWLANSQSEWPPNLLPEKHENLPGLRDTVLLTSTTVPATWEFYRKFSSYHKIVRVTATAIKAFAIFKSKLKNAKSVGSICITQDDLSAANTLLIKLQQLEVFSDGVVTVKKKQQLPRSHPLAGVDVTIDDKALISISGRVRDVQTKEPRKLIPLSTRLSLTKLFLQAEHKRLQHPGISVMMSLSQFISYEE